MAVQRKVSPDRVVSSVARSCSGPGNAYFDHPAWPKKFIQCPDIDHRELVSDTTGSFGAIIDDQIET